jgi:hypothetical protein
MTSTSPEILPPTHKYALMALALGVDESVPSVLDLGCGLHASRTLTLSVPGHWKEWLGSLAWDELHEANLFLWATAPTSSPDLLDAENSTLQTRVFMLYYGLMLAAPRLATTGRGMLLTGARRDDVDVRQHGWVDALLRSQGVFWDPIRRSELQEAVTIGNALEAIQNLLPFRRLRAAVTCFYAGLQAEDPAERIHEFVRTIEGCILPARSKTEAQFVSRTEIFVGPREHDWAHALFNVRSAVEHLNDRLESVAMPVREDAVLEVLRLAHESQALARYCLRRIFSIDSLREHFRDDQTLGAFWSLPEAERQDHWGTPLDLAAVRAEFDTELVHME